MLKPMVGAKNGDGTTATDKPTEDAYGNCFLFPLDFDLRWVKCPFSSQHLETDWNTISPSMTVIQTMDSAVSCVIDNISLGYDMATKTDLACIVGKPIYWATSILHRLLSRRKKPKNKSGTLWNINLNVPAPSIMRIPGGRYSSLLGAGHTVTSMSSECLKYISQEDVCTVESVMVVPHVLAPEGLPYLSVLGHGSLQRLASRRACCICR